METKIRSVEYFYTNVADRPGEAYEMLSRLACAEVNLQAFSAVPIGPGHTQLALFPESPERLVRIAEKTGLTLTGPLRAFLIQGDDRLGALVEIHRKLYDAGINMYASTGVTDGSGRYGYVMYVRPEDHENAKRVLGL